MKNMSSFIYTMVLSVRGFIHSWSQQEQGHVCPAIDWVPATELSSYGVMWTHHRHSAACIQVVTIGANHPI